MAFGNNKNDYAGTAKTGFGTQPSPSSGVKKTAEENTQSALCPKCRKKTVKDKHVGLDVFGVKPICTNPDCDWEGKVQLI